MMPMGIRAIFIAGLLAAVTAHAQPVPKINSISREWLQRGTHTQLTIDGENLSRVSRFIFSDDTEISATVSNVSAAKPAVELESAEVGLLKPETPDESKQARVEISIGADAMPGPRELRVVTPDGVSNPVKFNVTDLPEITEAAPDNSLEQAQSITLPSGISGTIGAANEVDYFRFKAVKGQRLIFDVNASRFGSPLDSSLALLDEHGKELARNEDFNGFDSLIDYTVPSDGQYVIQLRDFRYRGGGDYKYHIDAGEIPYLDSIYPFGGQRGGQVEIKMHGRNLGSDAPLKLEIDPKAPLGPMPVRARAARGYSNPRNFDVTDYPEYMEQEPNGDTTNANYITLPGTVNGQIQAEKDVDVFKFHADKGQRFIFEILASSAGSPLDALLVLRDPKNSVMQQNNGQGGANARIDQTFNDAGDYTVSVRDLLERGGPDYVYRLAVRPPPRPSFNAQLLSDTPRVARGNRTVVRVNVNRSDFYGPVEVAGEHLPDGVSCEPLLIDADMPGGRLVLSASSDAPLGSYDIELAATAEIEGKRVVKHVQTETGTRRRKKPGSAIFLTVLDTPPFTVDWVSLDGRLEQDSSGSLQGKIKRTGGFAGDLTVSVEGFTGNGDSPITDSIDVNSITVKGDAQSFSIPLKARLNSELGTRPIFLRAETNLNGGAVVQYSAAIPLTVREYPFQLSTSLPRLSITALAPGIKSASGEAEFSVKVSRRGWFTGAITLSIEGLPEGVVATSTNLPPNASEASFTLTTDGKAKPGTNTFIVYGTANPNGMNFRQPAPGVVLTINAPSDQEQTAKQ
jgi:hypothetical protein